jgi:hypothetical protein
MEFVITRSRLVTKKDGSSFYAVEMSNPQIGNCVIFCKDELPTKLVIAKDFQTMKLKVMAVGNPPVKGVK